MEQLARVLVRAARDSRVAPGQSAAFFIDREVKGTLVADGANPAAAPGWAGKATDARLVLAVVMVESIEGTFADAEARAALADGLCGFADAAQAAHVEGIAGYVADAKSFMRLDVDGPLVRRRIDPEG